MFIKIKETNEIKEINVYAFDSFSRFCGNKEVREILISLLPQNIIQDDSECHFTLTQEQYNYCVKVIRDYEETMLRYDELEKRIDRNYGTPMSSNENIRDDIDTLLEEMQNDFISAGGNDIKDYIDSINKLIDYYDEKLNEIIKR